MVDIYELPCYDTRKSFHGKAKVVTLPGNVWCLLSYNTVVAYTDSSGCLHRTWEGWSATTQRHVNSFLHFMGLSSEYAGKKAWNSLPVEQAPRRLRSMLL